MVYEERLDTKRYEAYVIGDSVENGIVILVRVNG
jgi:hypothetical protein